MPQFIHLRTYSDYSMGHGSVRIKDLIKLCSKSHIPAVALSDKNNLFAALEFSMEAVKNGVQPIIGLDLDIKLNANSLRSVLLLAKDDTGYQNLLKLSTLAFLGKKTDNIPHVSEETLFSHADGLIALIAGSNSVERLLFNENKLDEIKESIKSYHQCFKDRVYIEINRSNKTSLLDQEYEDLIIKFAYEFAIPLVATNSVCFLTPDMYEACDALMCITNGRFLVEDERPKASPHMYFKSAKEMAALFSDLPEAIQNTVNIAKRCQVFAQPHEPLLPSFVQDLNTSEDNSLANEAHAGLEKRITKLTDEEERKKYFTRLDYELSVITKMKYAGYFLIVSDFIKWSKTQDIPVGPGRGSGAGSVVAWSLEITDLDPIKFGLLFERFLNPDRISMPDFDIDFCQERRNEVIEYVVKKYGSDRVAQIITFGKLQARAVLRDVGRVLQIPYPVIDKICKMVPNNPANPVTLGEAIKLDKELLKTQEGDPMVDKLIAISLKLEGLNRHASTHAAGIVIADRPIVELVPLYYDQDSSMPAVQYSMKYAEAAGLVKFDFLGLKTLTVISWACKLINAQQNKIDINNLPLDDKESYQLLSLGHTAGIFQFESAGMKEAIKKLKPDAIEDLIALGSLYRPGPMDNIPSYINRKHGHEKPLYIHPLMETILKETYGIIVYQEQVMEIAKVLAGYTLGAADLLRRAMGKKIKSEMDDQKAIFINGCLKNGIERFTASEIFALIEKFASYGFNKSHAAAYAIISYQTAYLKAHYPVEFLIASMNLEINDTNKINLFCQEALRLGIKVLPPDINRSAPMFIKEDNNIRYALGALKNVGIKATELLLEERNNNGNFKDLSDFVQRCGTKVVNKRMLESLANSGAFDDIYNNRRQIFASSEPLMRHLNQLEHHSSINQITLFENSPDTDSQLPLVKDINDWNLEEKLKAEFEACGFYLTTHPIESYLTRLKKLKIINAIELEAKVTSKSSKMYVAGAIVSKKIRSSKRGKYAFIQLSDMTGIIDISVFNEELLLRKNSLLNEGSVIVLKVDARLDENGLRIIAEDIFDIQSAVANIDSIFEITIKDHDVLPNLKQNLSAKGKKFNLTIHLPGGEEILFSCKKNAKLAIDEDKVHELSKSGKINVIESCI